MKTTFYFTTYLTESEHYIIENDIRKLCNKLGVDVIYYRRFKNGHIPCYRECKLACDKIEGLKILKSLDIPFNNFFKKNTL